MQKCITAINKVSDTAVAQINIKKIQQTMVLLGLIASILVLLLTSLVSVIIYFNKNRRLIFAKYTFGYSFYSIHKGFIVKALLIPSLAIVTAFIAGLASSFSLLFIVFFIGLTAFYDYAVLQRTTHKTVYSFSKM